MPVQVVILFTLLSLCGCVSYTQIADVRAIEGMSAAEMHQNLGEPAGDGGSGIHYEVYEISKTKKVWIAILNDKAAWAYLKEEGKSDVLLFGK